MFIAVRFPPPVNHRLARLIDHIRSRCPAGRFVSPNKVHLTLVFLGPCPPKKHRCLSELLNRAAARHQPFALRFAGLGYFGRLPRPRVLWLGISSSPELLGLQHDLSEQLKLNGIVHDSRPFRPHLTLGRDVRLPPEMIADSGLTFQLPALPCLTISSIDLVASQRHGHSHTHLVLASQNLCPGKH
ncbi:MAG: RNA 2',3'-cyclic phosphodiesterase [Negativicutes bacterium]|nr:RNA 2',3'-cyclic phosphodiesterase [Negativicutes bacterium]